MRFPSKSLLKMSYSAKRNEFRKILITNLGLTSTDVDMFLDIRKSTFNIPCHRVLRNCQICREHNVNVDSLEKLHYCFKLLDYKLEHRIKIIKDIGVPIVDTSLLVKIIHHFNAKVSKFKEKTNIPANQDIAVNIFRGHVPNNLQLSNELTVRQYYNKCLLYCKTQLFNLPYLDDEILLHHHMKVKSISMIAETLQVLRNDLQYDDEMIRKNPEVICAPANNIKSLLNSFTDILGIPIVTFLRKYSYMLFQDVNNMKRLLILFKQHGIPDEHVINYMRIFLVSSEVFHDRMEMIKHHPDLNMWCKHPRILQIIHQITMTKRHMEYVDIMDSLKWVHPQTLLSSIAIMNKSVQTGIVSSKSSIKHLLMKELKVDLSNLLMRHQHWKSAAFVDIVQMLKYLKQDFTISDICPNIHIVLYKQSRVEKVLADLRQQYSQSKEYSFTNSQYLALCLYMLEKDNHFTGDGVWNNENMKEQSLEKQNTVEKSDDNTSIVKERNNNYNKYRNISIEDNDHNDIDHDDIANKNVKLSNNMCNISIAERTI